MSRRFSMFWGCTIPARFPFIEKSTRAVLEDLGARSVDVEGYTCCPEGTLVKALDEDAYYVTAARNLALAERERVPLVTPCNGCYSTFRSAQAGLKVDWRRREAVNELLKEEGLSLGAGPEVRHFVEWIYEEVGPASLAKARKRPFPGMRLAVHYGCHLLRPSPAIRWDSSIEPTKVEELVGALGAKVVDYDTKLECCGGALDRVGERAGALELCRRKLGNLKKEGVDALVVVCPSCFQQFDLNQAGLVRRKEDLSIPVLYYSELLALAFGHAPEELGLAMHRVPVDSFLEKWERSLEYRERIAGEFTITELEECSECRACEEDCPVTNADCSFSPTSIIGDILSGRLDEAIEEGDFWKCVECFTCYERCPSRLGMAEIFRRLKELAAERDLVPDPVRSAFDMFAETGSLGEPRQGARIKLGLGAAPERGGEQLRRILAQRRPGLQSTRLRSLGCPEEDR